MELREWEKVRQIAWSAFIAPHQDPKKLPKSIDKFMSLGNNNIKRGFFGITLFGDSYNIGTIRVKKIII